MKYDNNMCELLAELEYRIGSNCYNSQSYDGWNQTYGCSFRYPITLRNAEGKAVKISSNLNIAFLNNEKHITPESLKNMNYKFGSNELCIGIGLIEALEYLEERYKLNFNKLEEKRKRKQAECTNANNE